VAIFSFGRGSPSYICIGLGVMQPVAITAQARQNRRAVRGLFTINA
jgi:hypothetical protein